MKKSFQSISFLSCWLMAVVFVWTTLNLGNFRGWRSPISYDVTNYYCYLPAIFIEKDLSLKFYDAHPEWYVQKYLPNKAPNGNNVIKMTMGVALYYAPFFFIAHTYALLFGTPDGFSTPYRLMLLFSSIFFTTLGMFYLRKILLNYFKEGVTALVLLSIGIGTNLFYYTVHEPMSHAYLFFTFILIMYFTIKWHKSQEWATAAKLGFGIGLAILIRPTDGIIILIPLLYGVTTWDAFKNKIILLTRHWRQLIVLIAFLFIPLFFQMLYWKNVTGQWIFFSYVGEGFLWKEPMILDGLFSYRKGWFIYTPMMLFGFFGLVFLWKYCRVFFFPVILFTIINIYVVLSWWSWWYGGSYGLRAFIESYALLALPMGAFYQQMFKVKWSKYALLLITLLLCTISQIQTFEYRHAIIHYDSMSKDAYWFAFLRIKLNESEEKKLESLLVAPDMERFEKVRTKNEVSPPEK